VQREQISSPAVAHSPDLSLSKSNKLWTLIWFVCTKLKIAFKLFSLIVSETGTYNGFAQKCVDVSNNMELYDQWTKKRSTSNSYHPGYTRGPVPMTAADANIVAHTNPEDMMEWEPTQPTATQVNALGLRSKFNTNGYPSRRPEDRELLGKRAKWVDQEEIDARR
jgi:hypothetical protein